MRQPNYLRCCECSDAELEEGTVRIPAVLRCRFAGNGGKCGWIVQNAASGNRLMNGVAPSWCRKWLTWDGDLSYEGQRAREIYGQEQAQSEDPADVLQRRAFRREAV